MNLFNHHLCPSVFVFFSAVLYSSEQVVEFFAHRSRLVTKHIALAGLHVVYA